MRRVRLRPACVPGDGSVRFQTTEIGSNANVARGATVERQSRNVSYWNRTEKRNLRIGFTLIGIGLILVAGGFVYWIQIPPQLGTHDESFLTVDALYSAVRDRNGTQLQDCEVKLKSYVDSGKLPEPAWRYLNGVIQ